MIRSLSEQENHANKCQDDPDDSFSTAGMEESCWKRVVAAHGWIAEHVLPLGAVRGASAVDLLRDLAKG